MLWYHSYDPLIWSTQILFRHVGFLSCKLDQKLLWFTGCYVLSETTNVCICIFLEAVEHWLVCWFLCPVRTGSMRTLRLRSTSYLVGNKWICCLLFGFIFKNAELNQWVAVCCFLITLEYVRSRICFLAWHPSIRGACIEKDLADALLLRCSTLALGLVEEGIWVWAPELTSLRV